MTFDWHSEMFQVEKAIAGTEGTGYNRHGEPDGLIQTWLGTYAIATPGVKHAINSTTLLGPGACPR